jgi:AcrR family transcriptional regulator
MTAAQDQAREPGSTRELILQAAIRRFAAAPFEEVSLRKIATDVGVDVAYVHRSFGSKEALFAEALQVSAGPGIAGEICTGAFVPELVEKLFAAARERGDTGAGPMDMLIRSLASPKASAMLRDKISADFIEPMSERLDDHAALRASFMVAILLGFGIAQDVMRLEPLVRASESEIASALKSALQAMVDADLKPKGS